MGDLEDSGYITHPHTSAGRVPSARGYRYFVETMADRQPLPGSLQRTIRHQFHQAISDFEEWSRLAASVLARLAQNAALVTLPKANDVRVRHVELVELHATLALLIVVLREARVTQKMITLARPAGQETLDAVSARLNTLIAGSNAREIEQIGRSAQLSDVEQQILAATVHSLQSLALPGTGEVNLAGLPDVLAQPEFGESKRAQQIAEMLGQPALLATLLADLLNESPFQVFIGEENPEQGLRDYSVVLASYGLPGEMAGLIGVMGPTRMPYDRTIPTVRYVASLLTELVREVHG